ncbi:DNA-binding transcriptional regulator, LysR family [Thalassovita litoralis]|uniref:DNA-binding transcriptional regulator, LysR family n=1 Tax=Thalassovita litoralis TaxID=1010611 RepID=A0A521BQR5_9RHOB|nr:LysR substrate-binding domain-containing protein [Thalassovita litoralis]SMO48890.1 DNA-binding transcriptional regulator, LysR family [Thalassovita litoralis]
MADPLVLTLLRSFVAVIDCGSIQLAALRVGRSQSAVSMQIKRLEDYVGRPLFLREGRSLQPNPAGEDLLLHARHLLRLSDEALASLRRTEAAGVVRLGMPEDYATNLIGPALMRFTAEFPLAELELTFDTTPRLLRLLGAGGLDLAVITRAPRQPFAVLRSERLVWAAAPDHGAWLRTPLPVALFEAGDLARRLVVEALQGANLPYRVVSSTDSLLGLIAVAQAGLAVIGMIESCLPPGLIRIGDPEGLPPLPILDLSLVPGPGEPDPLAAHLAEFLHRELSNDGKTDL